MFIRRLPAFEYHTPATVREALGLMAEFGQGRTAIAGGTDLLIAMKKREVARRTTSSAWPAIDGIEGH